MKENGLLQIQNFLARIKLISSAEKVASWISEAMNPGGNADEMHVQREKLDSVWKSIIAKLQNAIDSNNFLPLLKDIILFLEDPNKISKLFSTKDIAEKSAMLLTASLRDMVRNELIGGLDQLFLGVESADDFLDENDNKELYEWLQKIIADIHEYAELRGIFLQFQSKLNAIKSGNAGEVEKQQLRELSNSLDSMISLKTFSDNPYEKIKAAAIRLAADVSELQVKKAQEAAAQARSMTRGSPLPATPDTHGSSSHFPDDDASRFESATFAGGAENQGVGSPHAVSLPILIRSTETIKSVPDGTDIFVRGRFEIIVNIKHPTLPDSIRKALHSERLEDDIHEWMQQHFKLSSTLIGDINKHRKELNENIQRYTFNEQQQKWIRKRDFLDLLLLKSEDLALSPATFFDISSDHRDLLFQAWRGKEHSETYQIWNKVRIFLTELLWQKANNPALTQDKVAFFRLANETVETKIREKLKKWNELPFDSMPELGREDADPTSKVKWRYDKFHALNRILTASDKNELSPRDFEEARVLYKCFKSRSLKWLRSSDTELKFKEAEEDMRMMLWLEAGGDGSEEREKFQLSQTKAKPAGPS